jgi:hypothetical protein
LRCVRARRSRCGCQVRAEVDEHAILRNNFTYADITKGVEGLVR